MGTVGMGATIPAQSTVTAWATMACVPIDMLRTTILTAIRTTNTLKVVCALTRTSLTAQAVLTRPPAIPCTLRGNAQQAQHSTRSHTLTGINRSHGEAIPVRPNTWRSVGSHATTSHARSAHQAPTHLRKTRLIWKTVRIVRRARSLPLGKCCLFLRVAHLETGRWARARRARWACTHLLSTERTA